MPDAFNMPSNYSSDKRDKQNISILSTDAKNTNFTVVLCVIKDIQKCPPMIKFKKKTVLNLPFRIDLPIIL